MTKSLTGFLTGSSDFPMRLALSSVFVYHGLPKVTDTATIATKIGQPDILVLLVGLITVLGGLGLLLSHFDFVKRNTVHRLSVIGLLVVTIGAILGHYIPVFGSVTSVVGPIGGIGYLVTILAVLLHFFFGKK